MIKNNKIILSVILFLIILTVLVTYIRYSLVTDGYFYIGGWKDTPQEALAVEAESGMSFDEANLKISKLIDILYFDNYAHILYVSKADTFVNAVCIQNSKGNWHFNGFADEEFLETPTAFVLNGDSEQYIINQYYINDKKTIVYGWKYSNTSELQVNNQSVNIKTYMFTMNDKKWFIDHWWIEDSNLDEENIVINWGTQGDGSHVLTN